MCLLSTKDEKGFTLVELMVVIIILAVLTGIAVPSYLTLKSRSSEIATEINMRNIASALAIYDADNERYPLTDDYPDDMINRGYLSNIINEDSWGNNYQYVSADGSSYILESFGRDGADGGGDDIVFIAGEMTEDGAFGNND